MDEDSVASIPPTPEEVVSDGNSLSAVKSLLD